MNRNNPLDPSSADWWRIVERNLLKSGLFRPADQTAKKKLTRRRDGTLAITDIKKGE